MSSTTVMRLSGHTQSSSSSTGGGAKPRTSSRLIPPRGRRRKAQISSPSNKPWRLTAYAGSDRTGLVRAMLEYPESKNVNIDFATSFVRGGRFHGFVDISGQHEHVESCIVSSHEISLFTGHLPRAEQIEVDPVRPGFERHELRVKASDERSVRIIAGLAADAQLSISFFRMERESAPHGTTIIAAEFRIDIHKLAAHQYQNYINGIEARDRSGEIDLVCPLEHN